MPRSPAKLAEDLVSLARRFHARGWVLGTSGNFSTVISERPLRLAITASSVDKRSLRASQVLQVDERGKMLGPRRATPSAETLLHLEIVRRRGAGAVLHTHSVWATMLSDVHAARGALEIEGYEMLKGLDGVRSHEHRERIPIIANDQDMKRLARKVGETLAAEPGAHALLLRRHGLYAWGATLAEAERHVEILEFLFETIGRTALLGAGEASHGTAAGT
jgi:methylthioribulose-1-phosphate dehydratase